MSLLAAYLETHGSKDLISGLEARPIIIFTNPGAQLEVRGSQIPIITTKELKSLFRRAKPALSDQKVEELKRVIGREVAP